MQFNPDQIKQMIDPAISPVIRLLDQIARNTKIPNPSDLEDKAAFRVSPNSPMSGRTTVAAAGSAVPLSFGMVNAPVMVKAPYTNTGYIYVGNDGAGDVSSTTGISLLAGDSIVFYNVTNLSFVMIDASVAGEGVAWCVLAL